MESVIASQLESLPEPLPTEAPLGWWQYLRPRSPPPPSDARAPWLSVSRYKTLVAGAHIFSASRETPEGGDGCTLRIEEHSSRSPHKECLPSFNNADSGCRIARECECPSRKITDIAKGRIPPPIKHSKPKFVELSRPWSSLSIAEHRKFLESENQRDRPMPDEVAREFHALMARVYTERMAYNNFLIREAERNASVINWISSEVRAQARKMWERKASAAKLIPRHYANLCEVGTQSLPPLEMPRHVKMVLREGRAYALGSVAEIALGQPEGSGWQRQHLPSIALDAKAQEYAQNEGADVVMTSSAFKSLMSVGEDWTLPVTVASVSSGGPGGARKVVLVDRALPGEMNSRGRNTWVFRNAFLRTAIRAGLEKGEPVRGFPDPEHGRQDTVLYNLWNFSGIKLLTRSKACAYRNSDADPAKWQYMKVDAKMTYNPARGLEVVSANETSKWFPSLYLLGDSLLAVAHIDPVSQRVIHVEESRLQGVLSQSDYKPTAAAAVAHAVLSQVLKLDAGTYLLKKSDKSNSVRVMRSVDPNTVSTGAAFDLHGAMETETPNVADVTKAFLRPRWRNVEGRIPDCFEPREEATPLPAYLLPRDDRDQQATPMAPSKYCWKFYQKGVCNTPNCNFPHIKRGCEPPGFNPGLLQHGTSGPWRTESRTYKHCFKFYNTGHCPNPDCPFRHFRKGDEPAEFWEYKRREVNAHKALKKQGHEQEKPAPQ
eukprot:m51a1_g120 hypothetical protein (717) ;mRNA; r:398257-403604